MSETVEFEAVASAAAEIGRVLGEAIRREHAVWMAFADAFTEALVPNPDGHTPPPSSP